MYIVPNIKKKNIFKDYMYIGLESWLKPLTDQNIQPKSLKYR